MKIIKSVEEFEQTIETGKVLVDFFATWCGPCRMLTPVLEELSEEVNDVAIIKVDVDELPELARRYAIMSIPTIFYFVDGQIVNKTVGFQDKQSLKKIIK
ncbi:MAG: thioredoxin [Bacilli bacterium]|nr:thioredoxin [Bacilli bacterium]